MRVADYQRLYDYGYWANQRLFAAMSSLKPGEFTQPVAGSYGSVRNTLVHVMSAEWGWIDRCGGHPRGPRLNPDDFPTLESVIAKWTTVQGYVRAFFAALTDEQLERVVEFGFRPGEKEQRTVGQLLQHGANHAVHHRGQVALMIRMLGHVPGDFDLLYYDASRALAVESR